jgi:hypothetical protein
MQALDPVAPEQCRIEQAQPRERVLTGRLKEKSGADGPWLGEAFDQRDVVTASRERDRTRLPCNPATDDSDTQIARPAEREILCQRSHEA